MYRHDVFEIGADGAPSTQHVIQSNDYELLAALPGGAFVHMDGAHAWRLAALDGAELAGGPAESRFAIAPDGVTRAQVDDVYRDGLLRLGRLDDLGATGAPVARDVVRAAWSPDGSRLAVLSQTEQGYALATWSQAGGLTAPRPLDIVYDADMAWLDDHRVALATPPHRRVFRWMDLDTGATGELAPLPDAELMTLDRGADGRIAFLTETTDDIRVWTWRVASPAAAPVMRAAIRVGSPRSARRIRVRWAADGASLVVFDALSGEMWSVADATGAITRLPGVSLRRSGGFAQLYDVMILRDRTLVEQVTRTSDVFVSVPGPAGHR
jgi:hypothetical protein